MSHVFAWDTREGMRRQMEAVEEKARKAREQQEFHQSQVWEYEGTVQKLEQRAADMKALLEYMAVANAAADTTTSGHPWDEPGATALVEVREAGESA